MRRAIAQATAMTSRHRNDGAGPWLRIAKSFDAIAAHLHSGTREARDDTRMMCPMAMGVNRFDVLTACAIEAGDEQTPARSGVLTWPPRSLGVAHRPWSTQGCADAERPSCDAVIDGLLTPLLRG